MKTLEMRTIGERKNCERDEIKTSYIKINDISSQDTAEAFWKHRIIVAPPCGYENKPLITETFLDQ